jgi:hypothetical protein
MEGVISKSMIDGTLWYQYCKLMVLEGHVPSFKEKIGLGQPQVQVTQRFGAQL